MCKQNISGMESKAAQSDAVAASPDFREKSGDPSKAQGKFLQSKLTTFACTHPTGRNSSPIVRCYTSKRIGHKMEQE